MHAEGGNSGSSTAGATPSPFSGSHSTPATTAAAASRTQLYAIQRATDGGGTCGCGSGQGSVNGDDTAADDSGSDYGSAAGSAASGASVDDGETLKPVSSQAALGQLDYVLRLCLLEAQTGMPHTSIVDVGCPVHPAAVLPARMLRLEEGAAAADGLLALALCVSALSTNARRKRSSCARREHIHS